MANDKPKKEIEYVAEEEASNTESKVKKLKKELKIAELERKEYLDGWQRERADFVNYKRDTEKYVNESRMLIKADIILQFLEILDNLELSLKHASDDLQSTDWYSGVKHVHKQFIDTLNRMGVQEVDAQGKMFDPYIHEAFEQVESDEQEGTILGVVQKGYKLGDKVLRVSKVRVVKNNNK